MDAIYTELWKLVGIIVSALVGVAVTYGIKWLKAKGIDIKNEHIKAIVEDAVNFAEQVGKELNIHGTEKFKKAEEKVVSVLAAKGIKLTTDEIEMLIKSAVKAMNDAVEHSSTITAGKSEIVSTVKNDNASGKVVSNKDIIQGTLYTSNNKE